MQLDDLVAKLFNYTVNVTKIKIKMLGTQEGRTQQNACAVLQDVCLCASGKSGCDRASKEEISILLNTLTAPAQSVRDASLRVCILYDLPT